MFYVLYVYTEKLSEALELNKLYTFVLLLFFDLSMVSATYSALFEGAALPVVFFTFARFEPETLLK